MLDYEFTVMLIDCKLSAISKRKRDSGYGERKFARVTGLTSNAFSTSEAMELRRLKRRRRDR